MICQDRRLAQLYAGLNTMDRRAAEELIQELGLSNLLRHSEALYRYGSALSISTHGGVAVPGGLRAHAAWTLTGVPPMSPGPFLRALLTKEPSGLLAFFYTLSRFDSEHQGFFTAAPERTLRYYRVFADRPEIRSHRYNDASFEKYMRALPLTNNGTLAFPGGREFWANAITTASAPSSGTVSDDEIVAALVHAEHWKSFRRYSDADVLVALANVEGTRQVPLSYREVALLAENYFRFGNFYGYLSIFSDLGERDYEHFFSVAHRLERLHGLEAHHAIAQFVSLIEITRLLHESGAFDDKAAAQIFRFVCDQFAAAHEGAGYSRAALTVLHRLAPAHGALVDQLLPATGPVSFEFQGQTRTFDY